MRTAVIGAMEVEVGLVKASMGDVRATTVAGMDFYEGRLGGTDVVVVRCGVGKVNAGICVQVLADRFGVGQVINTGVAGALDPRLDMGDIVVSTDCVQHDVDVTHLGYAPGQIPGIDLWSFPADEALRTAAVAAVGRVAPEVGVYEGRVVSGDLFVSDDAVRTRLVCDFGACCCEMEGAAIAQAAHLNGLPFVVVRVISDKVGSTTAVEYSAFEARAAAGCAAIVRDMVKEPD